MTANQCMGCQAGWPLVNGSHPVPPPGYPHETVRCTANRYRGDGQGRTWKLYANRSDEGTFRNIGDRRWVEFHYSRDPVVPVLVEEILGDRHAPEVTHYGWEDAARARSSPSTIQRRMTGPNTQPTSMLSMCFPSGVDDMEARGRGRIVALRITGRVESP